MTFAEACAILKAVVDGGVGYPVAFANTTAPAGLPPEPPAPWWEVAFHNVISQQQSIGAPGENDHECLGAVVAHIMVPRDTGDIVAQQAVDSFNALFRGKDISGVEIRDLIGDDGGSATGGWWRRSTRVEFSYQHQA